MSAKRWRAARPRHPPSAPRASPAPAPSRRCPCLTPRRTSLVRNQRHWKGGSYCQTCSEVPALGVSPAPAISSRSSLLRWATWIVKGAGHGLGRVGTAGQVGRAHTAQLLSAHPTAPPFASKSICSGLCLPLPNLPPCVRQLERPPLPQPARSGACMRRTSASRGLLPFQVSATMVRAGFS